ncbi:MAG: hypothetical protein ABUS79_20865, partial [Pseudomonadota bacterium]
MLISALLAGTPNPPAPPAAADADQAGDTAHEASPPPAPPVIDLAKLRAEYDKLRDELFRARARAALV